jgi:hypothetical protein
LHSVLVATRSGILATAATTATTTGVSKATAIGSETTEAGSARQCLRAATLWSTSHSLRCVAWELWFTACAGKDLLAKSSSSGHSEDGLVIPNFEIQVRRAEPGTPFYFCGAAVLSDFSPGTVYSSPNLVPSVATHGHKLQSLA